MHLRAFLNTRSINNPPLLFGRIHARTLFQSVDQHWQTVGLEILRFSNFVEIVSEFHRHLPEVNGLKLFGIHWLS